MSTIHTPAAVGLKLTASPRDDLAIARRVCRGGSILQPNSC